MKTVEELEGLRSDLMDRLYEEGQKLSGWTSTKIAALTKQAAKDEDFAYNEEWREVKANSALLGSLGSTISMLDKLIKERTKKVPVKSAAEEALEKIRGK